MNLTVDERLELFRGMVLCCHDLYSWTYDSELTLLYSNYPNLAFLDTLLSMGNVREALLSYAKNHRKPILMTSEMGNMWVAVPEKDGDSLARIHVLGPFFVDTVSEKDMEEKLRKAKFSPALQKTASAFLHSLPIVSLSRIFEYAIMLHYCLTGEKISVSDLHYQESKAKRSRAAQRSTVDAHGTYEMEQEMVRMVREGNLDFQKHMNKLAVTGSLGKLSNGDSTRQMKNATLVCIVLFSRAAIEGGLSPEIAMTLTDHYFQSVEACRSLSELHEITITMQNDFVERVHRCRANSCSKPVMECCDYINLHLEDSLSLSEVAQKLKYSPSHLSHKFKKEMGVSFQNYVRQQRLERAKVYLRDSSATIREVSERLHFCTPSYFAETFRAVYGVSPTTWREMK